MVLWTRMSQPPNGISIGSAVFCTAHPCAQHINRQTQAHRPRYVRHLWQRSLIMTSDEIKITFSSRASQLIRLSPMSSTWIRWRSIFLDMTDRKTAGVSTLYMKWVKNITRRRVKTAKLAESRFDSMTTKKSKQQDCDSAKCVGGRISGRK